MNSNAARHWFRFRTRLPALYPLAAPRPSSNDRGTVSECAAENRAPCPRETSKHQACCRRRSPDRGAMGPSPRKLCRCSCLWVRSLCKPQSHRKCLPDPRDCAPASPEPSEVLSPATYQLPAPARTNRNSDVQAACARNPSALNRDAFPTPPPNPLA